VLVADGIVVTYLSLELFNFLTLASLAMQGYVCVSGLGIYSLALIVE